MADTVGIRLEVQNRLQFSREMAAARGEVAAFGSETVTIVDRLASFRTKARRFGAAAMAVGKTLTTRLTLPIALAFGYAAKQASDLNETLAFTRVTFGKAAQGVIRWGSTTLRNLGLAKQTALDAASGFGGLFKTTGSSAREAAKLSQRMVRLAVDMASAKNVGLDEAMAALKSGLIGEAEPMRRFNVLLSENAIKQFAVRQGIAKGNKELTEAQKVQARLGIIMAQTRDIQGDYARTADSAANRQRKAAEAWKQAAATLGKSLVPFMTAAAKAVTSLARYFEKLSPNAQKFVVVALALAAVAGPLIGLIGGVATAIAFLVTPVGLVVAAVAILAIIVVKNWKTIQRWTGNLVAFLLRAFAGLVSFFLNTVPHRDYVVGETGPEILAADRWGEETRGQFHSTLRDFQRLNREHRTKLPREPVHRATARALPALSTASTEDLSSASPRALLIL